MKAWKKISALVLALGLTAGLVACGGGDNGNGNSNDGSTSSEAPATGTPERVDEFAMNTLLSNLNGITNFTMTGMVLKESEDGMVRADITMHFVDGKCYQVSQVSGAVEAGTTYSYMAKVDGVNYLWYSMDNENWTTTVFPAQLGDPSTAAYAFERVTQWMNYTYYEYNSTTGMNIFSNWGINETSVKVVDGKIVEYKIVDANPATDYGVLEHMTITYGNAVVGELPAINLVG